MEVITGFLLAALLGYAGAWYSGMIEGNFALLMLMAVIISGVYWLAEKFYFGRSDLKQLNNLTKKKPSANKNCPKWASTDKTPIRAKRAIDCSCNPGGLDWTAGLFPVILVVFVLRSFLFEPFKIPSGSMIPTLWIGDLILVNKFHYGVRLPVVNFKLTQGTPVARGDVMVFRYPHAPVSITSNGWWLFRVTKWPT
jgi:signal peptidase I